MKKIFTLLSLFAMAVGAMAQTTRAEVEVIPSAVNPAWGTEYDAIKGNITLVDGVMTCTDVPFSGASFSVELSIRDGQEGATRPMYNLVPKTGFTQDGELDMYGVIQPLYVIDNQPAELVVTKDGVNQTKFIDYKYMFGTSTSAQFIPGPDAYYDTVLLYLCGNYQQWTDGEWGEVKKNGYINFIVNVPVSGSSAVESVGIEEVDAPAEYFNLQGVRVSEPAPGQVVIRRQCGKTSKIMVR